MYYLCQHFDAKYMKKIILKPVGNTPQCNFRSTFPRRW